MRTAAKVAGGFVMTLSVVSLIVAILMVFKWEQGLVPRPISYVIATAYGVIFGVGLALGGYWMTTGRFRAGTLGMATAIVAVVSGGVIFWVYALMVAGVNGLGHPTWATPILAALVIGLVVWAVRHQLAYSRRAAEAIDAHPLASVRDLREGSAFRLQGRVILDSSSDLRGPVTGRAVAVLNLDVLETRDGQVGSMIVAQLEQGSIFTLRTPEGDVRVNAERFVAGYTKSGQHTGAMDPSDPVVQRALERPARGPLVGRELSIGHEARVDVLGLAVRDEGSWWLSAFDDAPLAIRQT